MPIALGEFDRHCRDHAEEIRRGAEDDMHFVAVVAPAHIGINARKLARRMLAPAGFVQALHRDVGGHISLLDSVLQAAADPPIGTAKELSLKAMVREAVLHLKIDRATERVEAEHRIVRLDVGAGDRIGRNEVEVDRVAERLVDAHAIHVNGEALRLAGHRRSDEAAIADIGLEAVALLIRRAHAREILEERLGDVLAVAARNVLGGDRLHERRHLVAIDAPAERRSVDDLDFRQHRLGVRQRRTKQYCGCQCSPSPVRMHDYAPLWASLQRTGRGVSVTSSKSDRDVLAMRLSGHRPELHRDPDQVRQVPGVKLRLEL